MKRIVLLLAAVLVGVQALKAQDTTSRAPVDSTLMGRDILSVMGPGGQVEQTATVRKALQAYIRSNAAKPVSGYRIRIFYDNDPSARSRSEGIERSLRAQYPDVPVYRSFESPNYKVCVGDYRSKDEALRMYNALKGAYPTAFLIKESINYPR